MFAAFYYKRKQKQKHKNLILFIDVKYRLVNQNKLICMTIYEKDYSPKTRKLTLKYQFVEFGLEDEKNNVSVLEGVTFIAIYG